MSAPFFSIIIPAHNAENYIRKGLESIRSQSFSDYELIVVCDACEDRTAEIAREYTDIVVDVEYHQDGLTRNAGLDLAAGTWVLFMDDDDWFLHEFCFQQLAEVVGQHDEDVLCFSYVMRDGMYIRQLPDNGLSPCVWSKCWRRSFISDVRFSFRKYWSDTDFHNKALRKPHKYVYWDMPLYYYNWKRDGSQSEIAEVNRGNHVTDKPVVISLTDPAKEETADKISCVDYVIIHKDHDLFQEDMYRPLCVGTFRKDGWLSELDGDNIAEYNDRINECTGLYWIWKNTDYEYVGLSHYRRYFLSKNGHDKLLYDEAMKILREQGYDIILTRYFVSPWSMYHNIEACIGEEMNRKTYTLFREAIQEKQPEYAYLFEEVLNSKRMYVCNMFVSRRKILNEYCEWLFSFLLDVTDKLDVTGLPFMQKRACGFYAEAMWTVWMRRQKYRVYKLPFIFTDDAKEDAEQKEREKQEWIKKAWTSL